MILKEGKASERKEIEPEAEKDADNSGDHTGSTSGRDSGDQGSGPEKEAGTEEDVLYADSVGMLTGTGLGTQNQFPALWRHRIL